MVFAWAVIFVPLFCRSLKNGHEFGLTVDGDEICFILGESGGSVKYRHCCGGVFFATSSSLRTEIHDKTWSNEAMYAYKRQTSQLISVFDACGCCFFHGVFCACGIALLSGRCIDRASSRSGSQLVLVRTVLPVSVTNQCCAFSLHPYPDST